MCLSDQYGLNLERLNSCVFSRNDVLNEIMASTVIDKKAAKRDLLIALNADKNSSKSTFVQELTLEIKSLREVLWDSHKDTDKPLWHYYQDIARSKEMKNEKKSRFNPYTVRIQSFFYVNRLRERMIKSLDLSGSGNMFYNKPHFPFVPSHSEACIGVLGGLQFWPQPCLLAKRLFKVNVTYIQQ